MATVSFIGQQAQSLIKTVYSSHPDKGGGAGSNRALNTKRCNVVYHSFPPVFQVYDRPRNGNIPLSTQNIFPLSPAH